MDHRIVRRVLIVGLFAAAVFAAGCGKKEKAPPTPPPAPPAPTTQTTPPAPRDTTPPTPTPPPAPPPLGSADLEPAFFDFDSYALNDAARAALDADATKLRAHADQHVTVEGHCDERGTSEYNQALGERRANAAKDYLVSAGIEAGRIQTVSYGKERPFDPGHDEAAWAKNRRAQIVVQ